MNHDQASIHILAFDDANAGPFPDEGELRVLTHGASLEWINSTSQLPTKVSDRTLAVVTNSLSSETMTQLRAVTRKANPHCQIILLTEKPHADYSRLLGGNEHELVDHFIAARQDPNGKLASFTTTDLRATLQKVIQQDFFGIEKYLKIGAQISRHPITSSKDRDPLHQAAVAFTLECGLSQTVATIARQIVQELLLNAIYDAPKAAGRTGGTEKSGQDVKLAPEDHGTLSFGFDGTTLALAARDPFGLFQRETFFTYARKALFRANSDAIIDTKVEGAGLGLMTMYLRSQGLICNVEPSVATEVIALIDVQSKVRDFEKYPRSLHYFSAMKNWRPGGNA